MGAPGSSTPSPSAKFGSPPSRHVFCNGRLADLDSKLKEFSVDPRCAPQWVGDAHVPNELTNIEWHLCNGAVMCRRCVVDRRGRSEGRETIPCRARSCVRDGSRMAERCGSVHESRTGCTAASPQPIASRRFDRMRERRHKIATVFWCGLGRTTLPAVHSKRSAFHV